MMKRVLCMVAIMFMLFAGQAEAVTFTQNEFITAESLDSGMTQAGMFFSLNSDYKSFYPAIRYGLGGLFEIGAKFGVVTNVKPDDKNGVLAGVDLKYQIIKQTEGVPLDMAVDIGFDHIVINGKNVGEVKFSPIFSKGFPLTDRGYKFTPYAGVQVSALYGSYLSDDHTNFYLFGGMEWKISQKFMVTVEVKTGPTTVGGAGIKFEF